MIVKRVIKAEYYLRHGGIMKKSKILFYIIMAFIVAVFIGGAIMFFTYRKPDSNKNLEENNFLPAESFDETTFVYSDEVSNSEKNTITHTYIPTEKEEEQPKDIEDRGTSVIIGGADGPTSIYLASPTDSDKDGSQDKIDITNQEYTAVIDRVLNEYNFEPVNWNNTIDWKEDADILVKMAVENKGRYKAYGIISKEKGSYGIVLIDTVDLTGINTNYVYEEWFYTGSSDGEPKMIWNKSRLYFTYPVSSGSEYTILKVV